MSAIAYALKQLRFTIPEAILKLAFNNKVRNWKSPPISLDELISVKLLRPRVLLDANLVGGETVNISLDGVPCERVDTVSVVYTIPPARIGNREIISVIDVSTIPMAQYSSSAEPGYYSATPFVTSTSNTVAGIGARIADSVSSMPITNNTSVELVGPNMVLVRNQMTVTSMYRMNCVLANETNLSNISPRSWPSFAKLVELAVKSYIFNTLKISIDSAFLEGGAELGYVREYVDGLSDAEEMYQTHLREVWAPTAFCNDENAYEKFIRVQICPNI